MKKDESVNYVKTAVEYDYNQIPAGYYDNIFHRGFGIQSAWHRQKFQFLSKLIPFNSVHLDIGCGPGTFLGNFSVAKEAVGVDIAKNQIEYAQRKYSTAKISFKHLSPSKPLPFEDSYFDVVSLVEVIEHLSYEELIRMMPEALRILRANGTLILSTPNYSSLWPLLEWGVNKVAKISYDEQHVTKFTQSSLRNFVSEFPLEIIHDGSYLLFSPFLAPLGMAVSQKLFKFEQRFSSSSKQFLLYMVARKVSI